MLLNSKLQLSGLVTLVSAEIYTKNIKLLKELQLMKPGVLSLILVIDAKDHMLGHFCISVVYL